MILGATLGGVYALMASGLTLVFGVMRIVNIAHAFALSALFIGIAAGIWDYYLTYLKPTIFFQILTSAEIVLMAILGGAARSPVR